jgi:3',5'-cyclic AMP phosphodiesterase CpdA
VRHGGQGVEAFRFVFMADCQLGCYASFSGIPEGELPSFAARGMAVTPAPRVQGCDWDAVRYERAVAMANAIGPDFVVMGGDMVDDPDDPVQFAEVQRITSGLTVPMVWVPGNHDIGEDTVYRSRFGPDHAVVVHHGATLVVVDTVVWDHPEKVPDEWDAQLAFLRSALSDARTRDGPTLVLGHHPLFLQSPDEPDDYWNIPQPRRQVLLDLFVEHGVSTYLCGHWHRNGRARYGDLEIVVVGPVGYPLGDDPSGFLVVDVDDAGVHHRYTPLTGSG